MPDSVFDTAFALTVGVEGVFQADPHDRGNYTPKGALVGTKFGISARSYPTLDIANLTLDEAKAIYRRDYWDKLRGDELPPGVALVLFDGAANSGVETAVRWAQAAAGVAVDGVLGAITLTALTRMPAPALVAEISARRLVYLAGLPIWSIYALGWARRVQAVAGAALQMESPTAAAPAVLPPVEIIKSAVRAVLDERRAA